MGYLILAMIVVIAALIGKGIIGYSLILPLVLAYSFRMKFEEALKLAFASGIAEGLVRGNLLGRESLGLLLAVGLIHLYERRFSSRHWLYYGIFAGLGSLAYSLVVGRRILATGVLIDVLLVFVMLRLVLKFKEKFFSDAIVLKV